MGEINSPGKAEIAATNPAKAGESLSLQELTMEL
jgi:hypothetical protein